MLHRKDQLQYTPSFEPEEGQPNFLCSNNEVDGCPSADLTEEEIQARTLAQLDTLARILVDIYFNKKGYDRRKK